LPGETIPFTRPAARPAPPRQAQPGQVLFEFVRASDRAPMSCELRFHGDVRVGGPIPRARRALRESRRTHDQGDGGAVGRGRVEGAPFTGTMIKKPTVFVLGAGASRPYGLLTAREIADAVMGETREKPGSVTAVLREGGFTEEDIWSFIDDFRESGHYSL